MTQFNRELAQALLTQTNSIDESARLMRENVKYSYTYWRREIVKLIESGELKL